MTDAHPQERLPPVYQLFSQLNPFVEICLGVQPYKKLQIQFRNPLYVRLNDQLNQQLFAQLQEQINKGVVNVR